MSGKRPGWLPRVACVGEYWPTVVRVFLPVTAMVGNCWASNSRASSSTCARIQRKASLDMA
eukprot:12310045-Prorocentrum_lima.AAC.1